MMSLSNPTIDTDDTDGTFIISTKDEQTYKRMPNNTPTFILEKLSRINSTRNARFIKACKHRCRSCDMGDIAIGLGPAIQVNKFINMGKSYIFSCVTHLARLPAAQWDSYNGPVAV
jgi:hypothetical protein